MTALGIGLVGAGIMLLYAGVTGQSVRDELAAAFGGGTSGEAAGSGGGAGAGLSPEAAAWLNQAFPNVADRSGPVWAAAVTEARRRFPT